jgi:Cyclic nucleotide-binding domain
VVSQGAPGAGGGDVSRPQQYVEQLVEAGSSVALPELTRGRWPEAVHRVEDRHGVGVIGLPTDALTDAQREALLRFRFAQYLAVGFVDRDLVHRERLEHEPEGPAEPDTIHLVAFSSDSGRVLAYLALRHTAEAAPGATLRNRERPLLPLEEHFGWGALNRLHLLPDLPLDRVRELGRFVKNQRLGPLAELGSRAAIEVCLATVRALTGPLRLQVEAFVGEFEDAVARRNLEFFHTPFVMLRGGLPAFPADHYLRPALAGRARYPFAVLVSDMSSMSKRADAIEAALAEPGMRALAALAGIGPPRRMRSSLAPPRGGAALADEPNPQPDLSLKARRRARERGEWLRSLAPFASLSETEATTLHRMMREVRAGRGDTVLTRHESSDALYLIARGEAEVVPAAPHPAVTLGPGDVFGEIGLLTGGGRTADVVARTALRLLCLSGATYRRYLGGLAEVEGQLTRLALTRAAAQLPRG